jgi:hypothetical protein
MSFVGSGFVDDGHRSAHSESESESELSSSRTQTSLAQQCEGKRDGDGDGDGDALQLRRHRRHSRARHHGRGGSKQKQKPEAEDGAKAAQRLDWTKFTWWDLKASLAEHVNAQEMLLLQRHEPGLPNGVNERDLGTTSFWNGEHDEVYPACSLLLLGFFCFVPWAGGALFMRARSPTARIAGILSAVLALMFFAVLAIAFFSSASTPFAED